MVGATGFEPATSSSQSWRSSQAELRSDAASSICGICGVAVGASHPEVLLWPPLQLDFVPIPTVVAIDEACTESLSIQEPLRRFERGKCCGDTLLTDNKERVTREHQPSIDHTSKHPDAAKALHVLSMMGSFAKPAVTKRDEFRSPCMAGSCQQLKLLESSIPVGCCRGQNRARHGWRRSCSDRTGTWNSG
jgi:hypothetical protein